MLKKLFVLFAMLYAAMAFAAVDVNKATAADLDAVKGIGPGISTKILDERKKGDFKDWNDLIDRVKGVGDKNAMKFSEAGLTVGGQAFNGAVEKPMAKKEAKPMAKDAAGGKPAAAATAATSKDEKAMAPADTSAADDKAAKAQAKEEAKAKRAAEKEAKAKAKADSAKPTASASK
jgi:competence protein ComEA